MSLANCNHCGKLFITARAALCPPCSAEKEKLYRQIREFVRTNPNSTALDVHVKTGIPIAKVLELQKEDYFPYS